MSASAIHHEFNSLSNKLQEYSHEFYNEGESTFHIAFDNSDENLTELTNLNPYHKGGTLFVYNDRVGLVSYAASESEYSVFIPSLYEKKDIAFYQQYTAVSDIYLALSNKEEIEKIEFPEFRNRLNESYDALIKGYGILNSRTNRQPILKDKAFGFIVLASLERKKGDQYFKEDISHSFSFKSRKHFIQITQRKLWQKISMIKALWILISLQLQLAVPKMKQCTH